MITTALWLIATLLWLLAISDAVWTALIVAVGTFAVGWMQASTKKKLAEVKADVQVVHLATNSRLDELVETTRKLAYERGEKDQRERSNQ